MRKIIYLVGAVALTAGLSACNKSSDSKKDADKAAAEILNKSVAIEPGTYQTALDCMDKEKTAKLPKVEMIYTFKTDGTYVENVKVLDGSCEGECGGVVTGTYSANEGSFTFNQKTAIHKDGTTEDIPESKTFLALGYVKEKGQIILQDEESDNACGGKMLWVMVKK